MKTTFTAAEALEQADQAYNMGVAEGIQASAELVIALISELETAQSTINVLRDTINLSLEVILQTKLENAVLKDQVSNLQLQLLKAELEVQNKTAKLDHLLSIPGVSVLMKADVMAKISSLFAQAEAVSNQENSREIRPAATATQPATTATATTRDNEFAGLTGLRGMFLSEAERARRAAAASTPAPTGRTPQPYGSEAIHSGSRVMSMRPGSSH